MDAPIQALEAPGSLGRCGGKGLNLGRMLAAGLPVPGGLVITTDAYRAFVAENDLGAAIDAAWEALSRVGPQGVEAISAGLRERFLAAPFPPALGAELGRRLAPEAPCAVRSSATAEDLPEASFAGQQDTYLNVIGPEAVLLAVRSCWASLWTARAMSYRMERGIGPSEVALAVVVQAMAPARAAGVMFTAHPLSGDRDQALINATWGLGEALVSGRVNPDTVVARKSDGAILRAEIGEKLVMTSAIGQGTAEQEVPEDRRAAPVLDAARVAELVAHGRALEALFGGPQDVEWALTDAGVVLLQSRAVTTLVPGDDEWPPGPEGENWPFDFWTQQDMGERWPDPITPLTWSLSEPMNRAVLDGMMADLKAPWAGRVRWTKRAYGRVYMNEGAMLHSYCHGFGMPLQMMRSGLTHPGAAPVGADSWQLGKVFSHLGFFWKAATGWEKDVDAFEAAFPTIEAEVRDFMASDRRSLSDADLLREARETWFSRIVRYVRYHTAATSLSMGAYTELEGALAGWGYGPEVAQELAGGVTGVIASEMVPAMAGLAATLRGLGLDGVVRQSPAEALEILRDTPSARPFLDALDRYLARHGHRCMTEAELLIPRWAEDPTPVLEQLAALLAAPIPPGAGEQAIRQREATTARLSAELGWLRRPALARLVRRLHRFTRMRDNGQHYLVMLLLPVRVLCAELGRRFAERGWLNSAEDLFFLVTEDLEAALAGPSDGLQGRAEARRAAWRHWCAGVAPDGLDAAGLPAPLPAAEGELVGIAASRGVVTGVARVVSTPQEAARLLPGEILVTRATDPGWTPIFSVIGGAVIEIGGMLSHGAIVAREYGLPAVINVPGATRRIADGERVVVDGTRGKVLRA